MIVTIYICYSNYYHNYGNVGQHCDNLACLLGTSCCSCLFFCFFLSLEKKNVLELHVRHNKH